MRQLKVIGLALLVMAATGASATAYDICTDAADCEARAKSDIAGGRLEQALDALVAEADLATGAGDDVHLRAALESLTDVNLKLGKPLMAHAWAQAAATAFDHDQKATATLENAQKALPKAETITGISGTYDSYAGYGYWSELKVAELELGKVKTGWLMMRFGSVPSAWDNGPAAMWELTADGQYSDGALIVTYQGTDGGDCSLTFKRTPLAIEWVAPKPEELPESCQIGGAGVFPWGPFWLVDTAVPSIEDADESGDESGAGEDEEP
ncbi:MAG: hypothetical protein R3D05_02360 [Dongiaceae bacterium]